MKLTFRPKNGIDGSASVKNFKNLLRPLSNDAKVTFEDGTMIIDDPTYEEPGDYLTQLTGNHVPLPECDYVQEFLNNDMCPTPDGCEDCPANGCVNRTSPYVAGIDNEYFDYGEHMPPAIPMAVSGVHPAEADFVKKFTDQQVIDEDGVDRNRAVLGINNEVVIHNQNREDNPDDIPYELKEMLPQVRYMNNIMANTIADYAFATAKQLFEYNTQMVTNMITESRKAGRREMCHVVDKAVESVTEDFCDEIDMTRDMIKQQTPKKKRK